jgi:hypothetical protein
MFVRILWMILTLMGVAGGILAFPIDSSADSLQEFVVYGVHKELDLGNPGETPQKDYYLSIGSAQGLREGSIVEVNRRMPTYDLSAEKLYKDVIFPIARLKVIHVEGNAAIARLDKMLPADKIPAMGAPRAVMVGDLVRPAN